MTATISKLPTFEGNAVTSARVRITRAGDGLSEALKIDPRAVTGMDGLDGRPRPCGRCGHLMAPEGIHRRLGVRRATTRTLCKPCWETLNRRLPRGRLYRVGPSRGIDEIAVERLMDGSLVQLPTRDELHDAIVRLDRYGYSARQIAERLGCTMRTVSRHRAAERVACGPSGGHLVDSAIPASSGIVA